MEKVTRPSFLTHRKLPAISAVAFALLVPVIPVAAEGGDKPWKSGGINRAVRTHPGGYVEAGGTFTFPAPLSSTTVVPWENILTNDGTAFKSQPTVYLGGGNEKVEIDAGLQYKAWHDESNIAGWEAFTIVNKDRQGYVLVPGRNGGWVSWRGQEKSYTIRFRILTPKNLPPGVPASMVGGLLMEVGGDLKKTIYFRHTLGYWPKNYPAKVFPTLPSDGQIVFPELRGQAAAEFAKGFVVKRVVGVTQVLGKRAELDGTLFECTFTSNQKPALVRWLVNNGRNELKEVEWSPGIVNQNRTGFDSATEGLNARDALWGKTATTNSQYRISFPGLNGYISPPAQRPQMSIPDVGRRNVSASGLAAQNGRSRYEVETIRFSLRPVIRPRGHKVEPRKF